MLTKVSQHPQIIRDFTYYQGKSRVNQNPSAFLSFPANNIFGNDSQNSNLENIPTEVVKVIIFFKVPS